MDVLAKANQMDPSKTLEKTKMLDITRDRPVKVAVKVAVPVRDHPKFNFVGKLLGPKGNSMKRLQEETMCKMAVLGRGSMRDRKKEEELRGSGDSRYAHLFEDLHVEISTFAAPAEAHARIAYALAEVRRFLVPDYHDDIRQEQMWEMQALTTSSNVNGNSSSSNSINAVGASSNSNCSISNNDHEQAISPNHHLIEGGITDMDTSNDDKSDESTGMDCLTNEKLDGTAAQLRIRAPNNMGVVTTNIAADPLKLTPNATPIHHPCAMTVTLQHQLSAVAAAAAGMGGILKPSPAAVTGLAPNQPPTGLALPTSEADTTAASALTFLETSGTLLHPALRNVKAINIAGNLTRKRPLLGVPRSSMNPTKRTVMTLLARTKNAQALHTVRNPVTTPTPTHFADYRVFSPLQMLASPFIIPHHHQAMEHHHHQTMLPLSKESLSQGV
ncbi:uncharacterized protein LOC106093636 isoform X1 [Stomoxys calcitrans]|uniref:uncharacterized protein LOC106093636 isoform X1 n=1 Tax=Stomoxys calcitrans TaxID=35570 RepID=UPI0027E28E93|nr:uncharacterized protein LOC106093636 isoform X1 [Stomoxys calcitrans]XP_059226298.1 uncharacterized protein LOC106093636 isoform X1 [Stomoxys calcitrans]